MPRMPRNNTGGTVIYYGGGSSAKQDMKIKALEQRLDAAVEKLSEDIENKIVDTTMGEDFVVNTDVGYIKRDMQVGRMERVSDLLRQMLRNDDADEEVDIYFYDGSISPERGKIWPDE